MDIEKLKEIIKKRKKATKAELELIGMIDDEKERINKEKGEAS